MVLVVDVVLMMSPSRTPVRGARLIIDARLSVGSAPARVTPLLNPRRDPGPPTRIRRTGPHVERCIDVHLYTYVDTVYRGDSLIRGYTSRGFAPRSSFPQSRPPCLSPCLVENHDAHSDWRAYIYCIYILRSAEIRRE